MPVAHITLLQGRTKQQKAAMAEEITTTIHKHAGAPREAIIVIFHDVTGDAWSTAGTLFTDRKKA